MHRSVSVLTDPYRRIRFFSGTCTGVPRYLNVIIVACADYSISWYIPPRADTAGRNAVDDEIASVRAISGVNYNREAAVCFVPNFLVALVGHVSGEMKTYLPRNYVLVVCCAASGDTDKIIFPGNTPIGVAV